LWLPKDDLRDSSSWSSSPLVLLRDIHSKILTQYDCKEVCAPSQSQVHVGVSSRLSSQDGISGSAAAGCSPLYPATQPPRWLGQMRPHRRDEFWSVSLGQKIFSTSMDAQIPAIPEKPLAACGCRKFKLDALGDHLCTCTAHSGAKKTHDWVVDQLADLFRTTHKVKTQQVVMSYGYR
jgi:hypothetical protein